MATVLTRTPSGGSYKIATFSAWVKKAENDREQILLSFRNNSDDYQFSCKFRSGNFLRWEDYASGTTMRLESNAKFTDVNGWYHVVANVDTTQSTSSNRAKLWVNGEEISLGTATYPSQNTNLQINGNIGGTNSQQLGAYSTSANLHLNGIMSHVHWIDGTAYDASAFGETDATTGEWKINTSPSVTYGTNGFFILKDGNSVTDQSGQSNNFTVYSGTLTKTEDNPSNVFATLNPLSFTTAYSLSNGNNTFNGGTITSWVHGASATLGASSGKYYWEVEWKNGTTVSIVGVLPIDKAYHCSDTGGGNVYNYSNGWQLSTSATGDKYNYVASTGAGFQRSHDDIIMFAMDMDNKKMWSGYNGTWYSSGNPATGANPTWDTSQFPSDWDNGFIPYCQSYYSGTPTIFEFNFGNGYFGTTAVSSAGTNASGIGIFEYDVPTGFTALSTKGLNL